MSANAAKTGASMFTKFRTWMKSPTGPKTTHFWGPVANWGFVVAVSEYSRVAEAFRGSLLEMKGMILL